MRRKTDREFPDLHPLKFQCLPNQQSPKGLPGRPKMDLPSQHVARLSLEDRDVKPWRQRQCEKPAAASPARLKASWPLAPQMPALRPYLAPAQLRIEVTPIAQHMPALR